MLSEKNNEKIAIDIDKIMEMIDWNKPLEIQEEGLKLAKNVKAINAFLQPLHPQCNKNVWENCAKILYDRSDDELTPYLCNLLEWLEDYNWPGAFIIEERLLKYKNDSMNFALNECINKATALNNKAWLFNLKEFANRRNA